jgi:hypothetical protein
MREIHRVLRPGGTALIMTPLAGDCEETFEDPSIIGPMRAKRHTENGTSFAHMGATSRSG